MKITSEHFQELIQKAQKQVLLSEINTNKIIEEIFIEYNKGIKGITYEYLKNFCSQIHIATLKKWDKQTSFEQFVKDTYPEEEEVQKLLIIMQSNKE